MVSVSRIEYPPSASLVSMNGPSVTPLARTVRAGGVTDGPFMETKEALGGFSVLETDTIEEAAEIAKTWPGVDRGWMTVEVRAVVEM